MKPWRKEDLIACTGVGVIYGAVARPTVAFIFGSVLVAVALAMSLLRRYR